MFSASHLSMLGSNLMVPSASGGEEESSATGAWADSRAGAPADPFRAFGLV